MRKNKPKSRFCWDIDGYPRDMLLFMVIDPNRPSTNRIVSVHRSPLTAQEVVDSYKDESGNTDLFIEQHKLLN